MSPPIEEGCQEIADFCCVGEGRFAPGFEGLLCRRGRVLQRERRAAGRLNLLLNVIIEFGIIKFVVSNCLHIEDETEKKYSTYLGWRGAADPCTKLESSRSPTVGSSWCLKKGFKCCVF